ncbi:nucleotidyltransferase family protein [Halobacillus fulvus]|nr:nucleotidyltransferase family protein [Halobacillus fulvus]
MPFCFEEGRTVDDESWLIEMVENEDHLQKLFHVADKYLENDYVAAGCITQTVWNHLHGYDSKHGLKDADIVYFNDQEDVGEEKLLEKNIRANLGDFPLQVNVKNEAYVHLWYERKFGRPLAQYPSLEHAIDTWPTTASAIGLKKQEGKYSLYAPFGLEDLFSLVVRPNKRLVTEEVYLKKASRWQKHWPRLKVMPWNEI